MGQMSGPNDVNIHSTTQTTLMLHGPLRRSDQHEKDSLSSRSILINLEALCCAAPVSVCLVLGVESLCIRRFNQCCIRFGGKLCH